MWVLRSSTALPFGRKVNMGAALCGLSDRITVEPSNPNESEDSIQKQNLLGKIPALILEDGSVRYDSRVILEWLDHKAGGGVIIPTGEERFEALTLQATADGIMDANVLIVTENRFRPAEMRYQPWLDR
jgi:glutathione S-transferase